MDCMYDVDNHFTSEVQLRHEYMSAVCKRISIQRKKVWSMVENPVIIIDAKVRTVC